MLDTIRQDFSHSLRSLIKSPAVPAVVIGVLALGIGANTALFSILDRVLLHPFPFREIDRLIQVTGFSGKGREIGIAPAEFEFLQPRVASFEQFALWRWQTPLLTGVPDPEMVPAQEVGPGLFDMLGVQPQLGRPFHKDDYRSSAPPVVLIGDRVWRKHFHADPAIVGRQILLDGVGHTVIGVMGPKFVFSRPADQLWMVLRSTALQAGELKHGFNAMARLNPGITLDQARREVASLSRQMPTTPGMEPGWHAGVRLFTETYTGPFRRALMVLWGAVGLVLLIACANAGNLLLARASHRRREFALRASLGASRTRLVRKWITESLLLGLGAGIAGTVLAAICLRLILAAFPDRLPISSLESVQINGTALAVTAALVVLTTLLCAIPPCLDLWRSNLAGSLNVTSRGASSDRATNRMRSGLIAFEIALSLVLLAGAGLMLRSLSHLFDVHLGFEAQQALTAQVAAPPELKKQPEQVAYYGRMLDEIRVLPGVRAAAINTVLPFGRLMATTSLTAQGSSGQDLKHPEDNATTHLRSISPDYFAAMGIRLLRGRPFRDSDGPGALPVAIVNDTLARRYWPGEDPVGKLVSGFQSPKPSDWLTVVGLVETTQRRSLAGPPEAEIYYPYTQHLIGAHYTSLVVRAQGDPLALAQSLRTRIHDVNPEQPISDIKTMEGWVRESTAEPRFQTLLFEIFAGLALALAATGVLAVVAYTVTQRTREIGIRGALGATPRDILQFVLKLGMVPVLIGVCFGIAGALATTPVLKSQLFETRPTEPTVLFSVVLMLVGTALCAAAIPAWRATRVDPATTLRAE